MARIHPDRLRNIIRFTLQEMDMHSEAAEKLLLGTAAHESHLGFYLMQYPAGPARGIYQMEPATEEDIWVSYLRFRQQRSRLIIELTGVDSPDPRQVQYNPIYATAMARLHYRRISEPFPDAEDLQGLAVYWDRHYNRNPDHGFPDQFVTDYRRLVMEA